MKKTFITGMSILILVAGIILFKEIATEQTTHKTITLGYCPTMKPLAEKIARTNNDILLSKQPSSAQALQELKNRNVDVALIGRKAKKNELESTNERILREGFTLVTNNKKFIQENELVNIKIHTSIEEDIVKQLLPNSTIQFYSTSQEAINQGLFEAVLINWNDYQEEYELFVVMKGTEKVEKFRIPVLYSNNYDLEKLNVEI